MEPANQLGIAAAQAALRQLNQVIDVGLQGGIALVEHLRTAWHGPKAADRIPHLGAVDHVVDQIRHRPQITATAADRREQLEVVGRPQQLPEP